MNARRDTVTTRVSASTGSYDVVVGPGLLEETGARVADATNARRVAVVSDDAVMNLYADRVCSSLESAGLVPVRIAIAPGEESKRWDVAGRVVEQLAAAALERDDAVLALGGGVVGDLAGFCAAVYLRGITFVQVPTTLLAMVDSSVGGKTAVDLIAGKNLAGAFKPPALVLADTDTLRTLPLGEWRSGMAEAVKSALLDSEEFTAWMEHNVEKLAEPGSAIAGELVTRCVRFKADVVSRDEHESGPRECLNYGHTLGHALEKVAGYGSITHGAAVAEGMLFASELAVGLGLSTAEVAERTKSLVEQYRLAPDPTSADTSALLAAMKSDKKTRAGQVRMVLVHEPGAWECAPVSDDVMLSGLTSWARGREGRVR